MQAIVPTISQKLDLIYTEVRTAAAAQNQAFNTSLEKFHREIREVEIRHTRRFQNFVNHVGQFEANMRLDNE
jgi:predicted secreted Zn-dependent protease